MAAAYAVYSASKHCLADNMDASSQRSSAKKLALESRSLWQGLARVHTALGAGLTTSHDPAQGPDRRSPRAARSGDLRRTMCAILCALCVLCEKPPTTGQNTLVIRLPPPTTLRHVIPGSARQASLPAHLHQRGVAGIAGNPLRSDPGGLRCSW